MINKRRFILLLAAVNLLLLASLLAGGLAPPTAYAQAPASKPGAWVAVTGKAIGQAYDALYLLDRQNDRLYALYPTSVQRQQYEPAAFRDLKADFQRE